jgi:hypothetical protein
MAQVVITVTDKEAGKIEVKFHPAAELLLHKAANQGQGVTPAEAMALTMARAGIHASRKSREQPEGLIVQIPKIG